MLSSLPRVYPVLGVCGGYALVMFFNPVRHSLGDGFRCIGRYKRIWISFALLGFGYFVFQFVTFTPIRNWADLDLNQITSLPRWYWPGLVEVWRETPLPALEGVAGIFDNATTTYPLSVLAAVFMLVNWRGLHGALLRALWKRYRFWGYFTYLILLLSGLASLLKPIVFWRLPEWSGLVPAAGLLRISATLDATAFVFEYLLGVYIQVYLITVCLAWIKGVSFEEGELFRFAMRRFSYVLEWAGIVVAVSVLIVRLPLLHHLGARSVVVHPVDTKFGVELGTKTRCEEAIAVEAAGRVQNEDHKLRLGNRKAMRPGRFRKPAHHGIDVLNVIHR